MAQLKADGKMIFLIFFGAIIGIVLLVAVSDQVTLNTVTGSTVNLTVTLGAVNASTDITGRTLLSRGAITNVSQPNSTNIESLTLQTGIGSGGLQSVQIVANDTAQDQGYVVGTTVNVTYTFDPDGFVSGTSNAILVLVILFGALGTFIFVVVQFLEAESVKNLMRR